MRAVGRVFAALVAYILALGAAALFMMVARVGIAPPVDPRFEPVYWMEFVVTAAAATSILGAMSFLPAMAMILVTEIFALRSLVVHVGFGGLLGAAAALGLGHHMAAQTEGRAIVVIAAGFIGGLVYWALAGRMAGVGSRPTSARPPEA